MKRTYYLRKNLFKIIALDNQGKTYAFCLQSWHLVALLGAILIGLALSVGLGFKVGNKTSHHNFGQETFITWQSKLTGLHTQLETLREVNEARASGLTTTIGEMRAEIFGLQDLSRRLAKIARVDLQNFAPHPPSNKSAMGQPVLATDLMNQVTQLSEELNQQSSQLALLESLLVHSDLDYDLFMQGSPIKTGYISSYYGQRSDPFHGKTAFHKGIDFAGEEGANIFAMAAGIVTFAGEYMGYGNFIEIDHGNGYTTRYAHNKLLRVKVGDRIEKGQVIAQMGTSGRSTGPHLHFEIMKNGQHLNPLRYVMR